MASPVYNKAGIIPGVIIDKQRKNSKCILKNKKALDFNRIVLFVIEKIIIMAT